MTPDKVAKLCSRVEELVAAVRKHDTLIIHQHIDESYYLAKTAELKLLMDQLTEAFESLDGVQARVCLHYQAIFRQW